MRHDDPDTYEVEGPPELSAAAEDVIRILSPLVTTARLQRIESVATNRTSSVVPLLEAFSDPHNVSAVLRTSEAMGLSRVDVVPGPYGFRASRAVSKGSHRWLDIHTHARSEAALDALEADGYAVFAAVMDGEHTPDSLADAVARGERIAIVFGNERRGVSATVLERATGHYRVPMRGFVESLNVSVAAAITLSAVSARAPRGADSSSTRALIARYLMHSVRDAAQVLKDHGV